MKKFRVWCKNNKQWEKDECFLSQDGKLYQLNKYLQTCSLENHIVTFETGLKDKNGKEIYEGDIIQTHELLWTVEDIGCQDMDENSYGMCVTSTTSYKTYFIDESILSGKVIGNVYENEELLK